jgi:hypothetical protein
MGVFIDLLDFCIFPVEKKKNVTVAVIDGAIGCYIFIVSQCISKIPRLINGISFADKKTERYSSSGQQLNPDLS